MWFGTNEGLNKYDGYEFTVYEKGDRKAGHLTDDYIQYVFEDSKDNLWIGTGNGGLHLYDYDSNKFIHFKSDSLEKNNLESEIRTILEDNDGNIWIAREKQIELVDRENHKIRKKFQPQFENDKFSNGAINVIYLDSNNNLWIGTSTDGLQKIILKTSQVELYKHKSDIKSSISDNDIRSIFEDSEGNMWFGTFTGGLNFFDKKRSAFICIMPESKNRESLTIRTILEDDKGNLWLGTRNGVYLYNIKSGKFKHYSHNPHNPNSLNENNIQVIYMDNKGDFWFGTKVGINFLNTANIPFVHYRAGVDNRKYLNHKRVSAILEDRYGDIWFGTVEGGLNRLKKETGLFTYYTQDPMNTNSISSNNVNNIAEDKDGDIWFGTFQGGLNHFDRKNNSFEYFKTDPDKPLLYQNGISTIVFDKNDKLWVSNGTFGLKIFDRKTRSFTPFYLNPTKTVKSIWGLYVDNKGNFWCGGDESQIYRVNIETLEYTEFKLPLQGNQTIINSITETPDRNLWIATRGSGLVYFNLKSNTFHIFTKKDGLPNNDIQTMIADDNKYLWLGTINGLCRFDIQTKKVKNFFKENGLPSNQFTYCSGFKTQSGEILLGTINGAVGFYPDEIRDDDSTSPVVITDFTIFNKPVAIGGEDPILNRAIGNIENINLSYKHSLFTFTYAALNYTASGLTKYAYKMDGFDKEWNYVGRRRFATYTNLNPGDYTFRVKATNIDGIWAEPSTSVNISIAPPFWETWWFMIIITAILFSIIAFVADYYNQKRNLQKVKSLANLTQLKLLRNQMNPHFLLNAFNALRALVLIDKEHAWQMISEFSEYFRYVLVKYNKIHDTLNEEIDAAKNYINIQKLLNDNLEVSFKVNKTARECLVPAFIFQPLIENAIKYGKKTSPDCLKIRVVLNYENSVLSIDVVNSGKLFTSIIKDKNNDRVNRTSISNIKKRLEIMFGDKYTFRLFEKRGYVHAKIVIYYSKKYGKESVNVEANELAAQLTT